MGARPGAEVVQVYVGFPKAAGEPPKELKGFRKVALKPGQAGEVEIALGPDAFRYWDERVRRWTTAHGAYQIVVGRSSEDIVSTLDWTAPSR